MARYNHFAIRQNTPIDFASLSVGEKFRKDFFKGKRRRPDILCEKTGELTYVEIKSKKEYKLFSADGLQVATA